MRICPSLHPRADIEGGYFSSPVALPLSRTLAACSGRFDDPKRNGWSGVIPPDWGAEDYIIGHNGNDLGPNPADDTLYSMADGKIVRVQATDVDDAGVWLAYRVLCPECGRDFLPRCLHLLPGSVLVKVGDTVVKGQPLARCDTSGSASWKHLHLDLRHAANDGQNASTSYGSTWGIPFDPQAWHILDYPPTTTPSTEDTMFCKLGDNSPTVKYWQLRLNRLGASLIPDGKYGPLTQAAVIAKAGGDGLQIGPDEAEKLDFLVGGSAVLAPFTATITPV